MDRAQQRVSSALSLQVWEMPPREWHPVTLTTDERLLRSLPRGDYPSHPVR
jgi:hypothetical protein